VRLFIDLLHDCPRVFSTVSPRAVANIRIAGRECGIEGGPPARRIFFSRERVSHWKGHWALDIYDVTMYPRDGPSSHTAPCFQARR